MLPLRSKQTFAFAPVLLLFLAIALPTLVLEYRSRLGLQPLKLFSRFAWEQNKNQKLPSNFFTFYFFLFTLIVVRGLEIFAVLPRFPAYQVRMFPVSSPINIQRDFTGRRIINPGYARQDHGKNQGSGDSSRGEGNQTGEPGLLNDNFYYGFNSRMNQNLRGVMKPKVVMRVQTQARRRFLAGAGV